MMQTTIESGVNLTSVEQRVGWLVSKFGERFNRLLIEAVELVNAPGEFDQRAHRMMEIQDSIAEGVQTVAICRRGCSHCCHQSVIIPDWEARSIARASGRAIASGVIGVTPETDFKAMRTKYSSEPCPFLSEGECSIYDVRPAACRTHFSMDNDPNLCDITHNPGAKVPYFNNKTLMLAHGALFFNEGCTFADIREFFIGAGAIVKGSKSENRPVEE